MQIAPHWWDILTENIPRMGNLCKISMLQRGRFLRINKVSHKWDTFFQLEGKIFQKIRKNSPNFHVGNFLFQPILKNNLLKLQTFKCFGLF